MKAIFPFVFFAISLLLQGCIEDDRLDFPDEDEPKEYTGSFSAMALLDHVYRQKFLPFEFVYPLDLAYTSGIAISAEDSSGLSQIAASQTTGFYIDRIAFPFLISRDQVLSSIESEDDFKALLISSGIPTLRNHIENQIFQCFDLILPISLLVDGEVVEFTELNQLLLFIEGKPSDYQPDIVFPITLKVFELNEEVQVSNLFDLFRRLGSCSGCPSITFSYHISDLFRYTFETPIRLEGAEISWYVNGDLVKSDVTTFEKVLPPEQYEVCLKVITPSCHAGVTFCRTITVAEECPVLHYEATLQNRTTYQFSSDFIHQDSIDYHWAVLLNDQVIKEELETVGSQDHTFTYTFANPGTYHVCLKATLEGCEIAPYCEEIVIPENPDCLVLSYLAQPDGTNVAYNFVADFEGRLSVNYEWSVFVDDMYQGGKNHLAGSGDHTFHWEFQFGVVYQVCLKQEGCTENKLCKEFVIN